MKKIKPIGKIKLPLESGLVSMKPILEIPEKFLSSENPEEHMKLEDIVEVHEPVRHACSNPEENLF